MKRLPPPHVADYTETERFDNAVRQMFKQEPTCSSGVQSLSAGLLNIELRDMLTDNGFDLESEVLLSSF